MLLIKKRRRGRPRKWNKYEENRNYFKKHKIKTYNNFIALPNVVNLVKKPKHKFQFWGSLDRWDSLDLD